MATAFKKLISNGNSALNRRAEVLESQARIAQQAIVDSLKKEIAELEIKIINLTDFAPNSKDSLRPGAANFNADEWAKSLQETKVNLWSMKIELKQAEETFNEYFTEE